MIFRVHAVQRMLQRSITVEEVRLVLEHGEIVEDYPEDTPYPSQLLLHWVHERPLHVVAAYNAALDESIVISVYQPDLSKWNPDFKGRRS